MKHMYMCPICCKGFEWEEIAVRHYLKCCKEKNLSHNSNSAPRSEDINTREDNDEVTNFFGQFQRKE